MADEAALAAKVRDAIRAGRLPARGGQPHLRRARERRHLRGLR